MSVVYLASKGNGVNGVQRTKIVADYFFCRATGKHNVFQFNPVELAEVNNMTKRTQLILPICTECYNGLTNSRDINLTLSSGNTKYEWELSSLRSNVPHICAQSIVTEGRCIIIRLPPSIRQAYIYYNGFCFLSSRKSLLSFLSSIFRINLATYYISAGR